VRSRVLSLLVTVAVLGGSAAALTAGTAIPAEASTPHNGLSAVWCASASSCLAVGTSNPDTENPVAGHPLAETWNGKSWKAVSVRLPPGAASGGLLGLSCVRPASCVAVGFWGKGFTGHELAESWNGKTWTPSEPPAKPSEQTELIGVSCLSAKACVAVGEYEPNLNLGLIAAVIEQWNGVKWTEVTPALPRGLAGFSLLDAVPCPTVRQCAVVGYVSSGPETGSPLIESWNGKAWKRVAAPSPAAGPAGGLLSGVSCASSVSCVAVGEKFGTSKETGFAQSWNGRAWTLASVPWAKGTANSILTGVSCPAQKDCVAVGATGVNADSGANSGRAAAATWNGKTWTVVPVPAPAKVKSSMLTGVLCPRAASYVAAGKAGPAGTTAGHGLSGFWNGKRWRLVTAV
jgi:hypothetical protein